MSAVAGEILSEARKYIARGWCQGAYCRSGMGREVALRSPWAKCWCPSGAIWRAARDLGVQSKRDRALLSAFEVFAAICAKRLAPPTVSDTCIAEYNDDPARTVEEVLSAFDDAIRLASPFCVMVPKHEVAGE